MSDMDKILRGVVRDHRICSDYTLGKNQTTSSAIFRHQFWRWIKNKAITRQNLTTPIYALVSFMTNFISSKKSIQYDIDQCIFILACYSSMVFNVRWIHLHDLWKIPSSPSRQCIPIQEKQLRCIELDECQPRQPLGFSIRPVDNRPIPWLRSWPKTPMARSQRPNKVHVQVPQGPNCKPSQREDWIQRLMIQLKTDLIQEASLRNYHLCYLKQKSFIIR